MEEISTNSDPAIKQGWLRAIVYLLVWAVCLLLVSTPFFMFITKSEDTTHLIYEELVQLVGTVLAIYICRTLIDRKSFMSLGFQFLWKDFVLGILIGIILISISCIIVVSSGWASMNFRAFDPASLVNTFTLFLVVAVAEEFMCRTYLLNNLMQSMNKYWALLITAGIFGVLHALNPNSNFVSLGIIMVAGLVLGLWYIYRLNIWFSVGFHLTWNYFQGAIYGFEVSGMKISGKLFQAIPKATAILSGGEFGLEGSITTLIVLVVGGYLLNNYLNKTTANAS